jgi:hypothetical protein
MRRLAGREQAVASRMELKANGHFQNGEWTVRAETLSSQQKGQLWPAQIVFMREIPVLLSGSGRQPWCDKRAGGRLNLVFLSVDTQGQGACACQPCARWPCARCSAGHGKPRQLACTTPSNHSCPRAVT